jgi:hypothetical protein
MSYNLLSESQKRRFAASCVARRKAYERWISTGEIDNSKTILIVGDRPGPKAPQRNDYHHTPFHGKKYSGGWLNTQLVLNGIIEDELIWVNSATWDGQPTTPGSLLTHDWNHVIALGKNAHKWCLEVGFKHPATFDHPQFHKRFKSGQRYALLDWLLFKTSGAKSEI